MSGSRPNKPTQTTRGKETEVCVALVPAGVQEFPSAEALIMGATGGAVGVTAITLANATTNPMVRGQGLLFIDPTTDFQYFAAVDADHEAGVTELTVRSLGEAIPAGAEAAFPPRFALRTGANVSRSGENEEVDTFDHENAAYIATKNTSELSLDGLYAWNDAGRETIEAAHDQKLLIYFSRTLAPPSPAYAKGERLEGWALVTSIDNESPNDGQVAYNVSLQVSGKPVRTDPVPAP